MHDNDFKSRKHTENIKYSNMLLISQVLPKQNI